MLREVSIYGLVLTPLYLSGKYSILRINPHKKSYEFLSFIEDIFINFNKV